MATRAQIQATVNGALTTLQTLEDSIDSLRTVLYAAKKAIDHDTSIDPQTWTQSRVDGIQTQYTPIYNAAKADLATVFNLLP